MNSKTHLVKTSAKDPAKHQDDPYSPQLYDLSAVLDLRDNGVNVVGIGYTIYIGSEYESHMMTEAAQLIADAHAEGLIVVLWMYPRGRAVMDEKDAHLIAGAAGVACCLGSDFVKCNPPKAIEGTCTSAEALQEAAKASGRTGLVCAGGSTVDANTFLCQLYEQIHTGGAVGNATGRNIHQRSLDEAVRLTKAISAITLADYDAARALKVFNGDEDFSL
jgi:fructose-bisphosphate aldolase, class I